MNLKQIETFLWIARLGGFAAAVYIAETAGKYGYALFNNFKKKTSLIPSRRA